MNTIGLRANPTIIKSPHLVEENIKFGKGISAKKIWRMVFDIEYGIHSVDMLKLDFELVPFIKELTEDAVIDDPVFRTDINSSNIVFREMDK